MNLTLSPMTCPSVRRLVPLDESDVELDEFDPEAMEDKTEGKMEDKTKVFKGHNYSYKRSFHIHHICTCAHTDTHTHTHTHTAATFIHALIYICSRVCEICILLHVFLPSHSHIHPPVIPLFCRWLKEALERLQGPPLVMLGRRHEFSFPTCGQRGNPCCN